jgi:hypothetical protein
MAFKNYQNDPEERSGNQSSINLDSTVIKLKTNVSRRNTFVIGFKKGFTSSFSSLDTRTKANSVLK